MNANEKYYTYDEARDILRYALSRISDLTADSVIESVKDDLEGIVDKLEPIWRVEYNKMICGGQDASN